MALSMRICLVNSFAALWVWSLLGLSKGVTYRNGLFQGLISFWGTTLNPAFLCLVPLQIGFLYLRIFQEKTNWFKKKIFKYAIWGYLLGAINFWANFREDLFVSNFATSKFLDEFLLLFGRKAFYSLSFFGLVFLIFFYVFQRRQKIFQDIKLNEKKILELFIICGVLFLFGLYVDSQLILTFPWMAVLVFFCLVPIEFFFQAISRFRSKRNFIYVTYILICFLDSHVEGRVKVLISFFKFY